jgi:DNA-directed RNA polymerase specialized sigma54-like protein
MEQNLLLKPVQTQTLTQYQLMSLNLLAMDTMELNRYLQEEYCSNPLLEEKERSTDTAVPMTPVNRTGKHQRQRIETLIQEDIPTEAFSPL